MRTLRSAILLIAVAAAAAAQEPKPATLTPESLEPSVPLAYAWRIHPGDDSRWADPAFDDRGWATADPQFGSTTPPPVAWLRRHVIVDRSLEGIPFVANILTRGHAELYVDGVLVARAGPGRTNAVFTFQPRKAHVVAMRYVPTDALPAHRLGIPAGYLLSFGPLSKLQPDFKSAPRFVLLGTFFVTVPLLLACLHLAFFSFYRRRRENLWYGLAMIGFAFIVYHDFRQNYAGSIVELEIVIRLMHAAIISAIFFTLLTYYEIRAAEVPRTWIVFAVTGAAIAIFGAIAPKMVEMWGWESYFALMVLEIFRVERSGRTVKRAGSGIILTALTIDLVIFTAQILINYNILPTISGFGGIYVLGIFAFAIGMSLFIAYDFARTNERELRSGLMKAELEAARSLQLSMLPREVPKLPQFDIAVVTTTASEVGGDYYDFRPTDDGTLMVAIGDATGHGVAAGAMVSAIKALVTAFDGERDLCTVLTESDRVLRRMAVPLQMCLALARVSADGVAYAAAAMPPMLVWRAATRRVEEIGTDALPMGGRLSPSYDERSAPLAAGDTLLFATDGLAEMLSPDGTPLGFDGAAEAFRYACGGTAQEVIDALLAKTASWRSGREQMDDMTLVAVRVQLSSCAAKTAKDLGRRLKILRRLRASG